MRANKKVTLIGAISLNGVYGIGRGEQGKLAWRSKFDMDFFRGQTTLGTVIMGRGTWQSLPPKFRPLPDRVNVIVTNSPDFSLSKDDLEKGVLVAHSIQQAIEEAYTEKVFIIGGFDMWNGAALMADYLAITVIGLNVDTATKQEGDHPEFVYFPQLLNPTEQWPHFTEAHSFLEVETPKEGDPFSVKFLRYVRKDRRVNDSLS